MDYELITNSDLVAKAVGSRRSGMTALRPVQADNQHGFGEEGFNLAVHATLRKDEWETVDDRVNEVQRERLTVVDDLRSRGLITNVSLGTILRVTERLEDFSDAELSYDGDTAPESDRPSYLRDTVPVPVISKDFRISWRQLAASRERGDALDTTSAELASRKVRDRTQTLFTNGFTGGPDGTNIPGLTTASNRMTQTITAWDGGTPTIIADVLAALQKMYAANLFGPFILYVPKNYWHIIQDDYSTAKGDRTYMERLLAFDEIESVQPNDSLADDHVVLLNATRDTIDVTEAQTVTTVQWEKNPFVTMFRVVAVIAPHIKKMEKSGAAVTTAAGSSTTIHGIVHMSV